MRMWTPRQTNDNCFLYFFTNQLHLYKTGVKPSSPKESESALYTEQLQNQVNKPNLSFIIKC